MQLQTNDNQHLLSDSDIRHATCDMRHETCDIYAHIATYTIIIPIGCGVQFGNFAKSGWLKSFSSF